MKTICITLRNINLKLNTQKEILLFIYQQYYNMRWLKKNIRYQMKYCQKLVFQYSAHTENILTDNLLSKQ